MTPATVGRLASVPPAWLPSIPLVDTCQQAALAGLAFVLDYQQQTLLLQRTSGNEKPLFTDFTAGRLGYRLAAGRARQEAVAKAVFGRHSPANTRVLDATAGLGRDAALLATCGSTVTLCERDPVLALLLRDGLERAIQQPFVERMTLLQQDSSQYLSDVSCPHFDVIYLDPMFAEPSAKAKVKKELAWLRDLLPIDHRPEKPMLDLARRAAGRRVVVKRAAKAPAFAGVEATSSSRAGKAVRFDIYTPL